MAERQCIQCGKVFLAKDPRARVCGNTCQKRKDRGAKRVELAPVPELRIHSKLVELLRAELSAAGRLDTALGALCLLLAERLTSLGETGSGIASMSKVLTAVRRDALAGVEVGEDPLSLLKRRQGAKARALSAIPGEKRDDA